MAERRSPWPNLAAALISSSALLAGCGGVVQADQTPAAAVSGARSASTPGPAPTGKGPPKEGGCADQPATFSPLSAASLNVIRRYEPGFRIEAANPRTVGHVIRPEQAAGEPWRDCATRRLVTWELRFGRVTNDFPCTERRGVCRRKIDDRLAYVVVRSYVGDRPEEQHDPLGPLSPPVRDARTTAWQFLDARTGHVLRAAQLG